MSTVHYAPFLAVLLILQFSPAPAASLFPSLSPVFGNPCDRNVCGRGNCVTANSTNFGYECICERGWSQARSDNDDSLRFLPCVIPNCSVDYSCSNSAAPPPPDRNRDNTSIFDPCYWADCGGGTCNKTSSFTSTCVCQAGYYNLFNSTVFPCYRECALGSDCSNLGINFSQPQTRTTPTPNVADTNSNSASLIPRVEFAWLIAMAATTLAMIMQKGA